VRSFFGRADRANGVRFRDRGEGPALPGRAAVAHRGYVANRSALTAALGSGAAPRALSDAELLAGAHARWGAELSRHVLGEFAAAVSETDRRRLTLAHDELGVMPLFYSVSGEALTFGTHLDEVVRAMGLGEIDEEWLADYLATGEHFGARTPYAHVRRLLPGESLVWEDGRLARHDVWTLDRVARLAYADPREYEEHLRRLVTEAVASALPERGTLLCELSGGLDSTTVLALACGLGAAPEALSLVYPQSYSADEREWIEIALRRYPVPWHPIDGDAVRPFGELPHGFIAEPNSWVTNAGYDRAYRELFAARGAGTVLTGEGGDAVLFGDRQMPFFLGDALLRGRPRTLVREAARWAAASDGKRSLTHALVTNAVVPALRTLRREALEARPMRIPWADERFAERTRLERRSRRAWLPRAASVGDAYVLQRVMRAANLIATHTHHRDIATEFRNPLLYRPLVEFALAVPWEHKLAPRGDRLLQRRAFADVLPAETVRRTGKGGGDQPSFDGLASGTAWVRALTTDPHIVARGYARLEPWRDAVRAARVGRTIGLAYLRASATVELWLQRLDEGVARDGEPLAPPAEAMPA
jgi:asparagine synthase (glutamine-hydrolysing)